jgi:hypothetical protein
MSVVLNATPGASNANSYLTLNEAQAYFDTRLFSDAWDNSDDQTKALIMATRTIDMLFQPYTYLITTKDGTQLLRTRPSWTGAASTTTQALSWPRTGMFDRNGNPIPVDVIPQQLKDAVAELAGQLSKGDRTLDSDVAVQGITSIKAGSVALTFKDSVEAQVIPDAVYNMLVPSWLTNEILIPALEAEFDVFS